MLLWAGAYKMTAPGADGITPLVSHSPVISYSRHDECGSRGEVHEPLGPVPFQGGHIPRGILLPDQLFREKGHPGKHSE